MSQTMALARNTQVLEVYKLVQGGMTIEDACNQVGITYKTYQRHAPQVLAPIAQEIQKQNERLTAQLLTAREKYIQDMIRAATNNDIEEEATEDGAKVTIKPLDWNMRLQIILVLERIMHTASTDVPPAPGEDAAYLSEAKTQLAAGPKTIRVRMAQGTTVEIKEPPPTIEGEYTEPD